MIVIVAIIVVCIVAAIISAVTDTAKGLKTLGDHVIEFIGTIIIISVCIKMCG